MMGTVATDLLNLIVEIKGLSSRGRKDKKATMDTYWVPGVNHLGTYGRWAFAEFGDIYEIGTNFAAKLRPNLPKWLRRRPAASFTLFTLIRNRSEASVRKQFGPQPQLLKFTNELWSESKKARIDRFAF